MLSQDDQPVEVEKPVGNFHLQKQDNELIFYVPVGKKAQDSCFASPLPTRLAAWLMGDPSELASRHVHDELIRVLTMLLCVSKAIVPRILDALGIIKVAILDEDASFNEADDTQAGEDEEDAFHGSAPERPGEAEAEIETASAARRATRGETGPASSLLDQTAFDLRVAQTRDTTRQAWAHTRLTDPWTVLGVQGHQRSLHVTREQTSLATCPPVQPMPPDTAVTPPQRQGHPRRCRPHWSTAALNIANSWTELWRAPGEPHFPQKSGRQLSTSRPRLRHCQWSPWPVGRPVQSKRRS